MQLNCWNYFSGFQFSGERTELSRPDGRKTIIETEAPTPNQPLGQGEAHQIQEKCACHKLQFNEMYLPSSPSAARRRFYFDISYRERIQLIPKLLTSLTAIYHQVSHRQGFHLSPAGSWRGGKEKLSRGKLVLLS